MRFWSILKGFQGSGLLEIASDYKSGPLALKKVRENFRFIWFF